MAKKTIYAIGFDLPDIEGFENLKFSSDISLLDADIIVIQIKIPDYYPSERFEGRPLIDQGVSANHRLNMVKWKGQINAVLSAGKTVLCFLTEQEQIYCYTGEKEFSGTGKSQKTTNIVKLISNYDQLPKALTAVNYGKGKSIILDKSSDLLVDLHKNFSGKIFYNAFFSNSLGDPLFFTKSGGHVVGTTVTVPKGNLLYLPAIDFSDVESVKLDAEGNEVLDAEGEEIWSEEIVSFTTKLRDCIFNIDKKLQTKNIEDIEPEWVSSEEFSLKAETETINQISNYEAEVDLILCKIALKKSDLLGHAETKRLLYAKGPQLENAVRKSLLTIGYEASNFKDDTSEFDVVFQDGETRFIGEVEGKDSKPINVDKISQLQRNINEDFAKETTDNIASGVLFGNAYRFDHPDQRSDFFTVKVIQIAKMSGISLVRTPDLFRVAKYVEDTQDMAFAKACREAIAESKGKITIFPICPD